MPAILLPWTKPGRLSSRRALQPGTAFTHPSTSQNVLITGLSCCHFKHPSTSQNILITGLSCCHFKHPSTSQNVLITGLSCCQHQCCYPWLCLQQHVQSRFCQQAPAKRAADDMRVTSGGYTPMYTIHQDIHQTLHNSGYP